MASFQYSAQFLASIARTVKKKRLTRYHAATGQNLPRALLLCEANIALSEALFGLLHGLEVAVRNAAHHALTTAYRRPTWYDAAPLTPYWRQAIQDAQCKVGHQSEDVMAALTFGFWVDLVGKRHNNTLWVGRLSTAFPNAALHRSLIHER